MVLNLIKRIVSLQSAKVFHTKFQCPATLKNLRKFYTLALGYQVLVLNSFRFPKGHFSLEYSSVVLQENNIINYRFKSNKGRGCYFVTYLIKSFTFYYVSNKIGSVHLSYLPSIWNVFVINVSISNIEIFNSNRYTSGQPVK